MEECQEPRCSKPAAQDWNGRKLCEDCYDKYRDEEEARLMRYQ